MMKLFVMHFPLLGEQGMSERSHLQSLY